MTKLTKKDVERRIEGAARTGQASCEGVGIEGAFMILFAGAARRRERIEGKITKRKSAQSKSKESSSLIRQKKSWR